MFESANGDFDIQKTHINGLGDYVITAGLSNNGILGKTDIKAKIFNANTITIDMFGNAFYRQFRYKMVTHARVFSLKPNFEITEKQGIFLSSALFFIRHHFGYENMCSWAKIQDIKITLPSHNGAIDFAFMETFIAELEARRLAELEARRLAELEAYLTVTGLKNYNLTKEEEDALNSLDKVDWKEYRFADIFNNIQQGRRLKKDDQIEGSIPFVMAGVTNTGIVNYISNPVATFPKNSITIDIFGNAFYRNYDFGAGDDTGVYWNTERKFSREMMLFLTKTSEKALQGKFSYGKKLRSSQSLNFRMKLPTKNGTPDYDFMNTYISAIHKVVIKEVVLYAEKKIQATKEVIKK